MAGKTETNMRTDDKDYCRVHRAVTDQNRFVFRILSGVVLTFLLAAAGWAMKANGDARAQDERNAAQDKRLDAFGPILAQIQQAQKERDEGQDNRIDDFVPILVQIQKSAREMAFTVGEMRGMLAVKMDDGTK